MKNYLLLIFFLAFAKFAEAQCSVSAQVVSNVTCYGGCDGIASVTAVTGTPPFSYQWIPAASTGPTASGLCAGPYAVMITDSNGCQASSGLVVISQPTPFSISVNQTSGQCFGDPGCWDVTVSGATPPYYFLWNTGDTGTSLCNIVTQGVYSAQIVDANGCDTSVTINFTWPPQMFVNNTSTTNVLCNGDSTGCATLVATGGVPPYFYNSMQLADSDTLICGFAAGGYTIVMFDSVGCSASAGVTITEPPLLTANICMLTNINCNGDSTGCAAVCVGGGSGTYTYSWMPSGGNSSTACNLGAGTYSVIVTDGHGCTTTTVGTVTQPSPLSIAGSGSTTLNCYGDTTACAAIYVNGGTPGYTYTWSPNVGNSQTVCNLSAGTYTATITDANGCTITGTVTITQPPQLVATVTANDASCSVCGDGSAYVTATGGTGAYTYIWNTSPIQMTPTATGLQPGLYTCCVWDGNGCSACASDSVGYPVGLPEHSEISDAVSVYPNPFHSVATLIIDDGLIFDEAELRIYDVIGNEVQRAVIRNRKSEIGNLSAGTYWLKISVNNKTTVKKLTVY
jgi:hypothetical protein